MKGIRRLFLSNLDPEQLSVGTVAIIRSQGLLHQYFYDLVSGTPNLHQIIDNFDLIAWGENVYAIKETILHLIGILSVFYPCLQDKARLRMILKNPRKLFYDSLFNNFKADYTHSALISLVYALNTLQNDPFELIKEIYEKMPPVKWFWAELKDPSKLEGLSMDTLSYLLKQISTMSYMDGKQKLRGSDKYLALVSEMHKKDASRTNVTQEQ